MNTAVKSIIMTSVYVTNPLVRSKYYGFIYTLRRYRSINSTTYQIKHPIWNGSLFKCGFDRFLVNIQVYCTYII